METIFNRAELTYKRKRLRNNQTGAEASLWKYLRRRQVLGVKFRRQYGIEHYIVDFYCPELRLVVEVDGGVHENIEAQDYDVAREKVLKGLGITVVRFSNKQVLSEINSVISSIKSNIMNLSSPFVGEVPKGRRGSHQH